MFRIALRLVASLWLAVLLTDQAAGHAQLRATLPAAGALLATAPDHVRLTFNEPVGVLQVRWLPPGGEQLQPNVAAETGVVVVVPPTPLAPGTHAVTWRVVSLDGHPVGGTLIFSIGHRSAAPEAQARNTGAITAAMARGCLMMVLAFGVGGQVWATLSRRPARLGRRAIGLCIILATGAMLGGQAMDLADCGIDGLASLRPWQLVAASPFMWTAILAMAAAGLPLAAPGSAPAACAAWLAASLSFAASGHAASADPRPLMAIAVAIHAGAAMFWIGALPDLLLATREGTGAEPYRRFARLATPAVLLLVASGASLAMVQVATPRAMLETAYGAVLTTKLVLAAALLTLAAINRLALTPALAAGRVGAPRRLALSIATEIALGVAILALAGGFRLTQPPRAGYGVHVHVHGVRVMADLSFYPGRAGSNRVEAFVTNPQGEPFRPLAFAIEAVSPGLGLGPISVRLSPPDAAGRSWSGEIVLPASGAWEIEADILVGDFEKEVLGTDLSLR
jgi:copper transport protein